MIKTMIFISIIAAPVKKNTVKDTLLLSEKLLEEDWNKPEEDEAWKILQPYKNKRSNLTKSSKIILGNY